MPSRSYTTRLLASLVLAAGLSACDSSPGPEPTCTLVIAPAGLTFSNTGGPGTIEVTASASSCEWTATPAAPWVAITAGSAGTGSGLVRYTVAPNQAQTARTTTIAVGTLQHTVTQEAFVLPPCTYALQPTGATLDSNGGSGSFDVQTASHCAWTAASTATWLAITEGSAGAGPGVVRYRAEPNTSTTDRVGTIGVADRTFTLTERGRPPEQCDYSVAPVAFTPCMAAGTVVARISTGPTCSWTVSTDVPWVTTRPPTSGVGSTDLQIDYTSNYDPPRLGIVMVRWPSPTAGQNLRVAQAGCYYGVSRTNFAVGSAGSSETFDVVQQSDPIECGGATQNRCLWSAVADVPWITVTSAMPRIGDDRVTFAVAANPGSGSRTGHITVRDKAVTIVQAGN